MAEEEKSPEEETEEEREGEVEEQPEPVDEEEVEEEPEEEEDKELSRSEVQAAPLVVCPECEGPMDIEGVEAKDVEERKFLFKTDTETHRHLKYQCSECGRYFLYDMDRERQGCFIATAAYGTAMAQEINVLRKFRDSYLIHRNWGKELVSLYYTISPPIADIIERSESLKRVVRTALLPIVKLFEREYGEE